MYNIRYLQNDLDEFTKLVRFLFENVILRGRPVSWQILACMTTKYTNIRQYHTSFIIKN